MSVALSEPQPSSHADEARRANAGWLRALDLTSRIDAEPERIFPLVIDELGERHGEAPALISEKGTLSFRGLAERSRRYARWALAMGLGRGDTVALLMPNCPDYLAVWVGISRVGASVALLNTNLSGGSLAHCIAIAGAGQIIVAGDLAAAFDTAAVHLAAVPRVWLHGADTRPGAGQGAAERIDVAIDGFSGAPLGVEETRPVTLADRALLIYTSGTTGLPKAANVSHHRVMMWSYWFAGIMATTSADRMYDCLPMYHSVGGVVAVGSVLVAGGSVVIRERFSARRFWDDVVQTDCTLFQYIGELCRYLLNAPPGVVETAHRLRLACGNGLRTDVWEEFRTRFQIPQILEFYAATEANFSLYNLEGKPGAVGRIPPFLSHRFPAAIVKFDVERGEPVRNAEGLCIRCGRNEVGEAIGRIASGGASLAARFEGYTSTADSEHKVLRNVFAPGDAWLRTGDLMRRDERNFFYFVDRIGDTFRWKGENVSTTEVAEVLARCPGVGEAIVYGVAVAGTEGRAGMAALVTDARFDLEVLHRLVAEQLPDYARPRFLRLVGDVEMTGTFKPQKGRLVADGFDPAKIVDRLYCDDALAGGYVPLDADRYTRIASGAVRL